MFIMGRRRSKKTRSAKRTTKAKPAVQAASARQRWLAHPLESLVFVLPFIFIYEIGRLAIGQSSGPMRTSLAASTLLDRFFDLFGRSTLWMPAAAVIVVLLSTHLSSGQPWRVRPRRVLGMYAESLAWALPLIALDRLVRAVGLPAFLSSIGSEITLSLGAAVYEEFIFRLALMVLIYTLGVDVLKGSASLATALGLIASSLLFAAHHHPPVGIEPFAIMPFVFRTLAGAYLAGVFLARGFALAVGAHAGYNVMAVLLIMK